MERETMVGERNETMGRIVARVWSDAEFKRRLLSDPGSALTELGVATPADMEIVVLENTAETTYLVLGAPKRVEPLSAIYDIKRFGDTYRDPRLHPLNWVSHDPVHTARIKGDPLKALAEMGVEAPAGMTVVVVENTWTLTHLVLPPQPDDGALDDVTLARLAAGHLGPTVRYAALDGPIDHRLFVGPA
jgi:nitrile hydratase